MQKQICTKNETKLELILGSHKIFFFFFFFFGGGGGGGGKGNSKGFCVALHFTIFHLNNSIYFRAQPSQGRNDNIDRLEGEVTEVTALLRDNVEKVVGRGERIDALQSRSGVLKLSISVIRIIFILLYFVCGIFFLNKCKDITIIALISQSKWR